MNAELIERIRQTNGLACLECGKCTSVCPVSTFSRQYSPRIMLAKAVRHHFEAIFQDYDLWSCLTCKKCDEYCPSGVHFTELIRALRASAKRSGFDGKCSHSGALQSLSRIMAAEHLKQNRLDWLPNDLKTTQKGDILYFVGCAPYFDVFFTDLELQTLDAARSSIRILNALGISPVLLPNERCCGHDLLWNGDVENFKRLAEHNLKEIARTGPKTILFSCAECMSAFKNLYPEHGFTVKAELKHMSQFLAEKIESGELELGPSARPVTYQDPCRLGRHMGIYGEPRRILAEGSSEGNGGVGFYEMKQSGSRSLCCGVSAWMNCDTTSKAIQTARLKQAKESGAQLLAVACPKCQIHLVCAMKDKKVNESYGIDIQDIATITLGRAKLK
ncbi:MAG: (Fe-S)-binding protein [Candidatus Neomarinimicrobiota bacterium]